jgi:hypothetical protein
MSELSTEYPDRKILEKAAEAEKSQRPYEYDVSGVEYDDIIEFFEFDDFGTSPMIMVPNRLKHLSRQEYLEQVFPNRSEANAAYRLTQKGWDVVDVDRS